MKIRTTGEKTKAYPLSVLERALASEKVGANSYSLFTFSNTASYRIIGPK